MTRTTKERLSEQRDELLSLQSIYGDDILSYKTQNCWKAILRRKWGNFTSKMRQFYVENGQECPLEVTIRIKPQAAEVYVHLDMLIVCGADYPDNVPQITLQNVVELPRKATQELKQLLLDEANKCVGMAMIFDLCQVAQQFLSEHNQKPVFSEHEKMLNKVAEKEIEQRRRRLNSMYREMEEVAAENERRRTEKLDRENGGESGAEQRPRLSTRNLDEFGDECEVVEMLHPNYGTGAGEKRRIYRLNKSTALRPSPHKFAEEYVVFDQVNEMFVTEWRFEFTLGRRQQRKLPNNNNIDFAPFERRLELFVRSANQKLSSLLVEDQQFFSAYTFINFKRCAISSPTNFNCQLLIGQTIEPGDKCLAASQVFDSIRQNSKYAPQLAAQMVCALKWLHGQGFYHGHLGAYSTWMLNRQLFRLSDYFLMPKLLELCAEFDRLTSGAEYSAPAEPTLPKRQSCDLFSLGELLNSIIGLEKPTSGLIADDDANKDAADFVRLCESADDVEQLIDHKYLVHDLTRPSNDLSVESGKLPMRLDTLGNSRLTKDFQVYQYLGKGGFGDVFLARNKLDDNDYAIKRIPLNPRNNRLNQRIKREAKLFSRLNHEHVVRFYAAWLESIPIASDDVSSTTTTTTTTIDASVPRRDSQLAAGVRSLQKSCVGQLKTVREKSDDNVDDDSSSDSSSSSSDSDGGSGKFFRRNKTGVANRYSGDDVAEFSLSRQPPQNVQTLFSQHTLQSKSAADHSEFDVVFYDEDEEDDDVHNSNEQQDGVAVVENASELPKLHPSPSRTQQILYIQMEYCKNSTLRAFIDSARLYGDPPTIWRLFREILAGLQYIHHQNMIHRDIKPMNIFLDINLSVKIGDFGLATRDYFGVSTGVIFSDHLKSDKPPILSNDAGLTKDVGTAMYIAPEIEGGRSSAAGKFYTSKIDVYSVGIVMFEMIYRPPTTSSERFAILQRLRTDVYLPDDFAVDMSGQQRAAAKKLIAWMLKIDPSERPTVDEILKSESIPCISYEDDDFQKTALQILRKRNSRQYKQLIGMLFSEQGISPALDYCYDQTICINEFEAHRRNLIMDRLRREFEAILRLHTFIAVPTHLLSCRRPFETTAGEGNGAVTADIRNAALSQNQCTLIDCSGLPVNLPRNLRYNFIRYCARNGVSQMKRYEFGKVFEPADYFGGIHPIERSECCVDLIGPALHRPFIAAECIVTSVEIIRKCVAFEGLKWTLIIGHSELIRAACLHQNISDEQTQRKVFEALHSFSVRKKKISIERKSEFLAGCCGITNQLAVSLLRMLETVDDFSSFSDRMRSLTRSKSEAVRQTARDALDEIAKIIAVVRQLCVGVKSENFAFDAGLCYRPHTFNGAFTYFLRIDLFHQGAVRPVAVLAGGGYDAALAEERRAQDPAPSSPLCAYGFNLFMEDLVQLYCLRGFDKFNLSPCSVLVCATSDELSKGKYDMTLKFWELGISADVLHELPSSVYNVLEHCERHSIPILVMLLKVDEAVVYVDESVSQIGSSLATAQQLQQQQQYAKRSSALLGYRIAQNKVGYNEAVRFVMLARNERLATHTATFAAGGQSLGSTATDLAAISAVGDSGPVAPLNYSSTSAANVNVNFAMDERPSHTLRKKIETQIRNVLVSELLPKLSAKTRVEVIVTELLPDALRQFAAHLDRTYEGASHLLKAVEIFQNAHKVTGRNKSFLKALVDAILPYLCGEHALRSGAVEMTGLTSAGDCAFAVADAVVLVLWCKQMVPTSNIFYRVIL